MSSITLKLSYATILLPETSHSHTCIGCVKTGNRRCRRVINLESWQRSQMDIIRLINRSTDDSAFGNDLLQAIRTLLCYHHREQAAAISKTLKEGLNSSIRKNPPRDIEVAVEQVSALERDHTIRALGIIRSRIPERPVRQEPETAETITREVHGLVGFIYMFRYPGEDRYLKIGYSKNITDRMRNIARACNRVPIVISDYRQRPIQSIREAENKVFARLAHFRRSRICEGCGKRHTEWFEVDAGKAIKIIESVRQEMERNYGRVVGGDDEEGWFIERWQTEESDLPEETGEVGCCRCTCHRVKKDKEPAVVETRREVEGR